MCMCMCVCVGVALAQIEILRKRRTNKMLVAMVTIFVVCWLPLNLLLMANDYIGIVVAKWYYFLLAFLITHVIAMSSTIYNPFLYAWMNDNFMKEFQQVPCTKYGHIIPTFQIPSTIYTRYTRYAKPYVLL